jgi:hypothetical protein
VTVRIPFWLWLFGVVVLGALFWPWLLFFGVMIAIVGVVGSIVNRRGPR